MATQKLSPAPHLVSRINWFYRVTFILAIAIAGLLTYHLLIIPIVKDSFNLTTLIFGLVSFAAAIWCITGYWRFFSRLSFFEDRLEISSFFNKINRTVYLNKIRGYKLSYFSGKYGNEEWLTVYTSTRKFVIYSWSYLNFNLIKSQLTRGRQVVVESEHETGNRMKKGGMLISTLIFISFTIYFYFGQATQPTTVSELITKVYTMADQPQLMDGYKGSKWLKFSVNELPGYVFKVGSLAYEKIPMRRDLFRGDTVLLAFSRLDYQKHIMKEEPFTFGDKYVENDDLIDVYGLKTRHKVYVPAKIYLNHLKWNNWGLMGLFLVGTIGSLGYYLYLLMQKKAHNPFE